MIVNHPAGFARKKGSIYPFLALEKYAQLLLSKKSPIILKNHSGKKVTQRHVYQNPDSKCPERFHPKRCQ
jgi:hypothetical protein